MALADAMIVQPVVEFFEPHAMQQSTTAMSHVVEGYEPTELELITYRQREKDELRRPIVVDGLEISTSFMDARESLNTNSVLSVQALVKTVSYFIAHGHQVVIVLPDALKDFKQFCSRPLMMENLYKMGFIAFVPCGEEDTSKALNEHLVTIATLTDGCVVTNEKMKEVDEAKLAQIGRRLLPPKWSKVRGTKDEWELYFDEDGPFGLGGADLQTMLKATTGEAANFQMRGCQQLRILLAFLHPELNGRFSRSFAERLYGQLHSVLPPDESNRVNLHNDYREGGFLAEVEWRKTHCAILADQLLQKKLFDEREHKVTFGSVQIKMIEADGPSLSKAVETSQNDEPKQNNCLLCLHLFDETPAVCPHSPLPPYPKENGDFMESEIEAEKRKKTLEQKQKEARELMQKEAEKPKPTEDRSPTVFMLLTDIIGADAAQRTMKMCPGMVDLQSLVAKAQEFGFSPTSKKRCPREELYAVFQHLCGIFGKEMATRVVQKYPECNDAAVLVALALEMPDFDLPQPPLRTPSGTNYFFGGNGGGRNVNGSFCV